MKSVRLTKKEREALLRLREYLWTRKSVPSASQKQE